MSEDPPLFYSQNFRFDFKSNFVEESSETQRCQLISPAFFIYWLGAVVVFGWILKKHSFGKFHFDINSKLVGESLKNQICQKI